MQYNHSFELVSVINSRPKDSLNLYIIIPPNTSFEQKIYPKTFVFFPNNFNVISNVKCIIDTAGIYNISNAELVTINGVDVRIEPGYYSAQDLETLLLVRIPISGPNSGRTTNGGTQLVFKNDNSIIPILLGYVLQTQPSGFIVTPNEKSTYIADLTNGFDTLNIKCNLINSANAFGNNYVATFVVNPPSIGEIIEVNETCQKPIILTEVSTILIEIYDKYNNPYLISSNLDIIFTIDIYDKC